MANIFKTSRANKRGLSLALDATLESSHDMTVFGLGALAEFTLDNYRHFALQRYHFYSAMENRFDGASSGAIATVWKPAAQELRQTNCLLEDLKEVNVLDPKNTTPSPSTEAYIQSIERASSDTLVAHLYCRYFADLFGGSMLGYPTQLALGVPSPKFYSFGTAVSGNNRAAFIEGIYEKINAAGDEMDEDTRAAVVEEAVLAFKHNANVIKEKGLGLVPCVVGGVFNVSKGYVISKLGQVGT